ncbi:MAG: DUF1838 family protein [Brevundimonas sp.]|uniref:DUF1838 family protein n=1 Tax=Brevundimonas sp. TaxID=1871086 RepID=UPI0025BB9608|nr:DUF1838 family protein [Brevundimonas sp.]MBX3478476.1 DUF1838 family protein [Brevundimonas sp.]
MKTFLATLAAGAALMASTAQASDLDLATPRDALTALRKVHCSTQDGQEVVYHWSGNVWSRVEGEPDRLLFRVEGMNIRQCVGVHDAQRGDGFRLVSRELMLYLDPRTGEVLRTWTNPWTGAEVSVMPVANDPVNMRPFFERDAQGRPFNPGFRLQDDRVFAASEIPLFYTNPLAGDYQDYVGNQYHAMEIFDFVAQRDALLGSDTTTAGAALAWVRIAPWLPWMKMGGRPGLMVFNAMGQTIAGVDALPEPLKSAIANDYPIYASAPPLDDARPNATSWTVARDAIDAERRAAAPRPAAASGH